MALYTNPNLEQLLQQVLELMESGRVNQAYNLLYSIVYPDNNWDLSA